MSYFHNSYSTLEDAWGDNFTKKKQKQNQKKKSNSVCNLYESRNAPVTKPYVSKAQKSNSGDQFNNEDEHFYDKYYGYSDAQKYSNKRNQINKYNKNYSPEKTGAYDSDEESFDNFIPMHASSEPTQNSTCFTTAEKYKKLPGRISTTAPKSKQKKPATMRNQFMYIDEENDTDEEPELKQPVTTRKKTNDTFYDSDEEFDEYMESKMLQRTIDAEEEYDMMIKGNNIDEENLPTPHRRHSQEESEEQYDSDEEHMYSHEEESMYLPKKRKTKVKKSMRVPPSPDDVQMELMLYTVTGIIFIFIMEQFVQIGMKLKKVPI